MENRQTLLEQLEDLRELVARKDSLDQAKLKYEKRGNRVVEISVVLFIFSFIVGITENKFHEDLVSLSSFVSQNNININIFKYYTSQFILISVGVCTLSIIYKLTVMQKSRNRIIQINDEREELDMHIRNNGIIHQDYCNEKTLNKFIGYLRHGQANNLQECINCYTNNQYIDIIVNRLDNIRNAILRK